MGRVASLGAHALTLLSKLLNAEQDIVLREVLLRKMDINDFWWVDLKETLT